MVADLPRTRSDHYFHAKFQGIWAVAIAAGRTALAFYKKHWKYLTVLILALLFGYFVWPGRYKHYRVKRNFWRVHRVTSHVEIWNVPSEGASYWREY